MGAIRLFEVLRRNFGNPPYGVIPLQFRRATEVDPYPARRTGFRRTQRDDHPKQGIAWPEPPIRYELSGACRTRTERTRPNGMRPIGLGGGTCGELIMLLRSLYGGWIVTSDLEADHGT